MSWTSCCRHSAKEGPWLNHEVWLDEMEGVALLVPGPSGVLYLNQVGGTRCEHPGFEAYLIPLGSGWPVNELQHRLERRLSDAVRDAWGLSDEDASRVDEILQNYQGTRCIRVDRTRLAESMEAWIAVTVSEDVNSSFKGFAPCQGVLTWLNSD